MSAYKGVKGRLNRVCWIRIVKSGTVNEMRYGFCGFRGSRSVEW